jgi:hypothetical protein
MTAQSSLPAREQTPTFVPYTVARQGHLAYIPEANYAPTFFSRHTKKLELL